MKKMLMLASVASMIDQFNMSNISLLIEKGYSVDVACNFKEGSTCSEEKILDLQKRLSEMNVLYYHIDFARKISSFSKNIRAYKQVKSLIEKNDYEFIHCHSPIGGVVGRLVGKVSHTKVMYTAHGFHFFKGAPIRNWIVFYPIEKFLSKWTDILITINKEDYSLANKKFHMKAVYYIPGVGVDINRFSTVIKTKSEKRKELQIPQNAFVLLSVGELSARKNQMVVIEALGKIRNEEIYYVIAGKGELYDEYERKASEYEIGKQLILLGPRTDIDELCVAADVFVHPSIREGLGIAPLEAMAAGLPLISSYVNGIKDYTKDGETGCCIKNPMDVEEVKTAIIKMKTDHLFRNSVAEKNKEVVKKFSLDASKAEMETIYSEIERSRGGYNHFVRSSMRTTFGLNDTDFVLISVGEVNKNKNHKIVIEAIAKLNISNVHYFIVGQGQEKVNLKKLADKLCVSKQIHFMGYRQDIKNILCAADAFCFPSRREGLGLAAIEAMASGLPLITSNVHGINDYSKNGETGYSCNPKDVRAFSEAISMLMNEDRYCYRTGNAYRAKMFDVSSVEKRMNEIYERI